MAIFFYDKYSEQGNSSNFGDDINPILLENLFSKSLIENPDICLLGIGTIISDQNAAKVSGYKKKVVFTSGVGYGTLLSRFDDSWDFVCVRGPLSANALGLPKSAAICDGAILLSKIFPLKPYNPSGPTVLIPHVDTDSVAGVPLRKVAAKCGFTYLVPKEPISTFIETVQSASLVITEAMHGAILAETMRVPWHPIDIHHHNEFKWKDWFSSISMDYRIDKVTPKLWNRMLTLRSRAMAPAHYWKECRVSQRLKRADSINNRLLGAEAVIEGKQDLLLERVAYINETYG